MSTAAARSPEILPNNPARRYVGRTAERAFFGGMAVALCVIVVIGFWPSYFGAGIFNAPLLGPIFHVHGAVFTLWMILYLTQSALISAHRVAWHRSLGTVAFLLPPVMIVLGAMTAVRALALGVKIGPLAPDVSAAIPLIGIAAFTVVIFASWKARRTPDAHKRLILLATIGLADAALGRFPWSRMGVPPAGGAVLGLGILILCLIAWDLVSLRRLHRSTLWAAPFVFAVGALAVPIGMTSVWHRCADFLVR